MAILTKSGRTALAEAVAARPLHLAWGLGDGAWGVAPVEDGLTTGLQNEIGRRQITNVSFAVHGGLIIVNSGSFSVTSIPTNMLYFRVDFDFADAPSAVIREVAVFTGSVMVPGLPVGQRYFTPGQVQSPGRLLLLQNTPPTFRSSTNREHFEFVIEF